MGQIMNPTEKRENAREKSLAQRLREGRILQAETNENAIEQANAIDRYYRQTQNEEIQRRSEEARANIAERQKRQWYAETPMQKEMAGFLSRDLQKKAYSDALERVGTYLKYAEAQEEETGIERRSAYDAYSPLLSERLQSSFASRASIEDELLGNKSQSVFSPKKTMQQEVLDAYDQKILESNSPLSTLVRNGLGVTQNTNPYADSTSKFRSAQSDFVASRAENETAKQNVSTLKNTQSILQLEHGALDIPESKVYGKAGSNSVLSGETSNIAYLLQNPGREYMVDTEGTSDRVSAVSQMSQNEKTVFLKYYGSGEAEKAQQYFDALLPTLYERQFSERYQQIDDASKFTQTMRALGGSAANVGAYAQAATDLITGRQPEMNAGAYAASRLSSLAREQSTEDLNNTGKFLANVGYSMADNAISMMLGPTGSLVWLGLSAAGSTTTEALESGKSLEKALGLGTASGLIETATEKMGIDNLFRTASSLGKKGVRELLTSIAKQAGAEGTEELISEYANTVVDLIANGQDAEYYRLIRENKKNGMSEDEAVRNANLELFVKNPLLASLSGALSGALFGAGAQGVSAIQTKTNADALKTDGYVPDIIDAALRLDPNGEYRDTYLLAQKLESDMRVRGDTTGSTIPSAELIDLVQSMPEGTVDGIYAEKQAQFDAEQTRLAEERRAAELAEQEQRARAEDTRTDAEIAQENAENTAAARDIVSSVLSYQERNTYRAMIRNGIDAQEIWDDIAARHEADIENAADADDGVIQAVYSALQDKSIRTTPRQTQPNGYRDADAIADVRQDVSDYAENAGHSAESAENIAAAAADYYEAYAGANFTHAPKAVREAREAIRLAISQAYADAEGDAGPAQIQQETTRIASAVEQRAENVGASVPSPVRLPNAAAAADGTASYDVSGVQMPAADAAPYRANGGFYADIPESGSVNAAQTALRGSTSQFAPQEGSTSSSSVSADYRLSKQGEAIRDRALSSVRQLIGEGADVSVGDREVEIANIAGKLGVKLEFAMLGDNINGLYKNGVVYLNPTTNHPYTVVFAHELMHLIEQRGAYADIRTIVRNGRAVAESGASWDELVTAMQVQYEDAGENLSRSDAEFELIANIVGDQYLNTPEALADVVGSNRRLGRIIRDWINHVVQKLSGEEIRAASDDLNLLRLQAAVEEALAEGDNVPQTEKAFAATAQQETENAAFSQRETGNEASAPQQETGKQSVGNFSLTELAKAAQQKRKGVDAKTADQEAIDRGREKFLSIAGRLYNIPKETIDSVIRDSMAGFDADMDAGRGFGQTMRDLVYAINRNQGEVSLPQTYKIADYQNVRDYLKKTPILVDDDIRFEIPDFNSFSKQNIGKIRLAKDGTPVDVVFRELSGIAPGLFNEDETPTKGDQIRRIADVVDMLYEKTDAISEEELSADRMNRLMSALANYAMLYDAKNYGTIGYGTQYQSADNPKYKTKKVVLPKRTSKTTKTNRSAVTIAEAAATKDAANLADVYKLVRQYSPDTNSAQMERARTIREKSGSLEAAVQKFKDMADHPRVHSRSESFTGTLVLGQLLLSEAASEKSIDLFTEIMPTYMAVSEEVGRAMQAQKILKSLSPEGQLITMQKTSARAVESIRKRQSRSEQKKQESDIQNAKDRSDVTGEISDLMRRMAKLNAQMETGAAEGTDAQAQLDSLKKELRDRQRQLRKLVRKANPDIEADIADVLLDIYDVTQSIEHESQKDEPGMGVLNALRNELRRKQARLKSLSSYVGSQKGQETTAENRQETQRLRDEIRKAQDEIDALNDALGKKDLRKAKQDLRRAQNSLKKLRDTFDERRRAIADSRNATLSELSRTLSELAERREILDAEKAELLEGKGDLRRAEVELNRVNRNIDRLNEKINQTRNLIEETIARLDIDHTQLENLKGVADMLRVSKQMSKEWNRYVVNSGRNVVIPKDLQNDFLNAKTQEERDAIADRIVTVIAEQLPGIPKERARAWRYFSMLGNVRTHMRNIFGNVGMLAVREMKDVLGAGFEAVGKNRIAKLGGDRTKAALNPVSDKQLLDLAGRRFEEVRDAVEGNKYSEADKIEERRKIFKTAAMEWLSRKNQNLLSAEDTAFLRVTFRSAYAQYLKANGYSAADELPAEFETRAVNHAIREAQEATFHDPSKLAKLMNRIENINGVSQFFFGGLVPFKATPINVAKRMVEYSPVSIATSLKGLVKPKSAEELTDALNKLAKGVTGSGLMVLGSFLAKAGFLIGGAGDDESDKEKNYRKFFGRQEYAVRIGDATYTVDWLAPGIVPMFAGAYLYDAFTADGFEWDDILGLLSATSTVLNPMLELSMMDGISSALKSYEEGGQQALDIAASVASSYLSQFIPTLVGQIARSIDPIQRSYYATGDSRLEKVAKKFVMQTAAKIPGLSKLLQPAVDVHGNQVVREGGTFFGRLLLNTLSPGYLSLSDATDVDRELLSLFEESGNTAILPKTSTGTTYVTVDGETYKFTPQELTAYYQTYGSYAFSEIEKLMASEGYAGMTSAEKIDLIESIYKDASDFAKTDFLEARGLYSGIAKSAIDAKLYGTEENERNPPAYMERLRSSAEFSDARVYRIDQENLSGKDGVELYTALLDLKDVSEDDRAFLYLYRSYGSSDDANAKTAEMLSAARAAGMDMDDILEAKLSQYDATGKALSGSAAKSAALRRTSLSSYQKYELIPYLVSESKSMTAAIAEAKAAGMSADRLLEAYEKYSTIKSGGGTASDQNLAWSRYLVNLNLPQSQFAALKNNFIFSNFIPIEDTAYDRMTEAGISDRAAAAVVEAVSVLKPEEGKKTVSNYQRYIAASDAAGAENADKLAKVYLSDLYEDYAEKAKKAGVPLDTYIRYRAAISGLEADKDPKTGKTINGSKREKVIAKIDSIPGLNTAQKDALYLENGYAKSNIYDTPWH